MHTQFTSLSSKVWNTFQVFSVFHKSLEWNPSFCIFYMKFGFHSNLWRKKLPRYRDSSGLSFIIFFRRVHMLLLVSPSTLPLPAQFLPYILLPVTQPAFPVPPLFPYWHQYRNPCGSSQPGYRRLERNYPAIKHPPFCQPSFFFLLTCISIAQMIDRKWLCGENFQLYLYKRRSTAVLFFLISKVSFQALCLLLSSPKEVTRKGRALRKRGKQSLFCSH